MWQLITWLTLQVSGVSGAVQMPDTLALGVALAHARTVVEDGDIQVSPVAVEVGGLTPVPGSWNPEHVVIERAARVARLSYGRDDVAVRCVPNSIACRAQGSFRGLVHVAGIRFPASDSIVVTLRMVHFRPRAEIDSERDDIYVQIDEVHVARRDGGSNWQIVRVRRISES
jgi:hypothetical protein